MDHRAQAEKRILWQYRNGENYKRWIDTLPAIAQESIEKPADLILNILDIDRQEGEQLDILGRIVGVKRQAIVVQDSTSVFSLGGGQLGDDDAQLSAQSYNASSPFGDEVFRLLLRARISKNNNDATIDGIIEALSFIVGDGNVRIRDDLDMSFLVVFSEALTGAQRFVIENYDIIPRPQGVELLGYTEAALFTQLGGVNSFLGEQWAQLVPDEL